MISLISRENPYFAHQQKIIDNRKSLSRSVDVFDKYSISDFGIGFFVFFGTVLVYLAQKTDCRVELKKKGRLIYKSVTTSERYGFTFA